MSPLITFDILTIFPDLLESPLKEGIISQAIKKQQVDINLTNIRDFAFDKHHTTDDRPFGGGEGMVMKPEPLAAAVSHVKSKRVEGKVVLLTPQGKSLNQALVQDLSQAKHLILVCGRYEGVDERFRSEYVDEEISIGDYILSGGELGALNIVDAVTRILPGVLGCSDSADKDTFSRNLLKHPQYTRPRCFEDIEVPEKLLSGNHEAIQDYRFVESILRTIERRPDLLLDATFSKQERKVLKKNGLLTRVTEIQQGFTR